MTRQPSVSDADRSPSAGVDVIFGGGGKDFVPKDSNKNVSKIERFQDRGYQFVTTNSSLFELDHSKRALGLFGEDTLPTWVDRHVFPENLADFPAWNPENKTFTAPSTDVPGLKEMTLKALDILHTRSKADGSPFMMMSEAASIDKGLFSLSLPLRPKLFHSLLSFSPISYARHRLPPCSW